MIEEEEKSWLDLASSVKVHVYNKLLDTDIGQAGAKLLQSVNEIQDQLRVLQAEECQFTFLSKWPSVISWLNEYNKVKQAVLDGQREQHNASCISQMFRRLILNHDGSPVDTPIDNAIKLITEKMSGVSINEKSGREQSPNDGDDGFVLVDSSDVDCNRQLGNNKDEHACLQNVCQEQAIENANLKKKLEQFGNEKDEHDGLEKACHEQTIEITDLKKKLKQFGNNKDKLADLEKACHEQTIEITDLKQKLEQFGNHKDEHACLQKACHEQTIEITDLKKKLENLKEEHACLEKTSYQQKIQIEELLKNQKPFGNNKDEHANLEKACHEQNIEITDLKQKLEQFGNHKDEHACLQKACHDLKKKLENLKEEHACLEKTSYQQKIQIEELLKNQKHSIKTCDQLKTQIGDLKKNLESHSSEKEKIVNLISSIEKLTPQITKSKQVCKKLTVGTTANDSPNLKACKKMMQPVMDAIVDSANNLISQGKDITIRNGRITELESENGKLRQQQFEHQTKEKQYYDYIQTLTIEHENAKKRLGSLNSSVESWRLQCADKEKKIQILQAEKDDLQTRLSSIAGEKLAKGNPAITDLSDPNRPMKISEKYGELYDNEWTDAIECTDNIRSLYPDVKRSQIEEIIIRHLYKLLTMCYKECLVLSRKQLRTIGETVANELNLEEEEKNISNIPGCGEVCKFRRQYADMFAEYLVKHKVLTSRMDVTDWEYVHKNANLINELAVTPFFEKCVHLCWFMAIQDPIMHLSEEPIPDSKYDKNMYKEFVQSGDKVKFVVWPTLFLHDGGPILYKGVVQAYS